MAGRPGYPRTARSATQGVSNTAPHTKYDVHVSRHGAPWRGRSCLLSGLHANLWSLLARLEGSMCSPAQRAHSGELALAAFRPELVVLPCERDRANSKSSAMAHEALPAKGARLADTCHAAGMGCLRRAAEAGSVRTLPRGVCTRRGCTAQALLRRLTLTLPTATSECEGEPQRSARSARIRIKCALLGYHAPHTVHVSACEPAHCFRQAVAEQWKARPQAAHRAASRGPRPVSPESSQVC